MNKLRENIRKVFEDNQFVRLADDEYAREDVEHFTREAIKSLGGEGWDDVGDYVVYEFPSSVKRPKILSSISDRLKSEGYDASSTNNSVVVNSGDPENYWDSVEVRVWKDVDNSAKGKVYYDVEIMQVY